VVADEVHRWKTRKHRENWDVLSKGGITRTTTLTWAITTAGVQKDSPLAWNLHEKTRRIQQGIVSDPRFFGRIYGADREDDPGDPKTWIKANPSLIENGGFLDKEKIRREYESAVAEGDLTSFKRYFLNMWDQREDRAIQLADWDACPKEWRAQGLLPKMPEDKLRALPHDMLKRFIERKCWAGVDLSSTTDLTAIAFVFLDPRSTLDGSGEAAGIETHYEALLFFWMPQDSVRKRELRDGMPYSRWADEGFLELAEGKVIDYRDMQKRLEWGREMFDLQEICWDPWNSRNVSAPMIEEGYKCVEVGQNFRDLNAPTKKLLELIAQRRIHHGGHPVLRWNASCASLLELNDNKRFRKPEREKESSRIDGIAAIVDALFQAMLHESDTQFKPSIFDNGPVVISSAAVKPPEESKS
jgi:phage terminase large subunit-like protein